MNTMTEQAARSDVIEHAADAMPLAAVQPMPVIAPPRDTSPDALLAIALERGAPIEMLERLMALKERFEANEARKGYHDAVAAFRAEPIEIFKRKGVGYETKDGNFVGYKHAELSDVTDAIAPYLAKHGLSYRWDERVEGKTVHCTCIVSHRMGHEERGQPLPGPFDDSGKKNQIQQLGSTLTYLRRYTLLGVLGLSTKGEDDDGEGSGRAEADRREQWKKDQLANIAGARTPRELKSIMDYAMKTAEENADDEMVASLQAAYEAKLATAKPKTTQGA